MATIIYDLTVIFTDMYIDKFIRTKDQMNQAARSGKQNIAEGSQVSGTSKKSEIKLVGVARGSLAELLDDCEDFIRQRGYKQWDKDSAYLLDKQLRSLEKDFLKEGGFTERLYRKRREYRLNMSYKPRERGQALLELIIVIGILVLILVALVSLIILSLSTIQKSRLQSKAIQIAQDGIENIKQEKNKEWTCATFSGFDCEWEEFKAACRLQAQSWAYGTSVLIDGMFVPTAVCTTNGSASVVTTVVWTFGGKTYNVSLETELGSRKQGIFR